MRKLWVAGMLVLFLTGCGSQPVFETVEDVWAQPVSGTMGQIQLQLPDEAALPVMDNGEGEKIYLCDGYTITLQTLPGGDLDRTLRTVTGYGLEGLQPMQTRQDGVKRTECVWSAAGEGELQVGRCAIVDDGNFHYAVSVMAGQSQAGELEKTWQELLGSFSVIGTAP